jgi:CheY-like chemotaxis protein
MKKVLIVDDDPVFLSVLAEGLRRFVKNFTVMTAEDGADAITLLKRDHVSLLVTDLMMPNVDGLALLAYVNEHHPSIPCFVMTAYETSYVKENLPRDILRFFRKPVSADKLGPEIIKTIDKKTPRGAVRGIAVTSFLLMIELEKKTCLFEVQIPGREKGLFFFDKGVLCDAVYGDLKGKDAALALITRERAAFTFKPFPKKQIARRMETPVKALVDEKFAAEDPMDLTQLDLTDEEAPETTRTADAVEAALSDDTPRGKALNLPGRYISQKYGKDGIIVLRLSKNGLLFSHNALQLFDEGDQMDVEFELDDNQNSRIRKSVSVVATSRYRVSAQFQSTQHYDALGQYLLYKSLDSMIIFDPDG